MDGIPLSPLDSEGEKADADTTHGICPGTICELISAFGAANRCKLWSIVGFVLAGQRHRAKALQEKQAFGRQKVQKGESPWRESRFE